MRGREEREGEEEMEGREQQGEEMSHRCVSRTKLLCTYGGIQSVTGVRSHYATLRGRPSSVDSGSTEMRSSLH